MQIQQIQRLQRNTIESLLAAIPFFRAIKQHDENQFDLLLQHSRIMTYRSGEVVLQRGDGDQHLYFLLKGQLLVYPDEELTGSPVNSVTPGEVFGDWARLTRQPRSATVVADNGSREIMVFSCDFSIFGALETTQPISLHTKLCYYRNTVHSLRWKLEVYRCEHPDDSLANRHRRIKLYMGPKDCLDELRALHQQAQALAALLVAWNKRLGVLATSVAVAPEQSYANRE